MSAQCRHFRGRPVRGGQMRPGRHSLVYFFRDPLSPSPPGERVRERGPQKDHHRPFKCTTGIAMYIRFTIRSYADRTPDGSATGIFRAVWSLAVDYRFEDWAFAVLGRRPQLVSRTPAGAKQRPRGPRPVLVPARSARSDLARLADREACRRCRHPRTGVPQGASRNGRLRGRLPGCSRAVADDVRAVTLALSTRCA